MTARLRTVFFGSSEFSLQTLRKLIVEQDVLAVCTRPDRPAGRGLALTPTPVARLASESGVEVLAPARLDAVAVAAVASKRPQLLAVASYGRILPRALLDIPGATALNLHPSLLPAYRGATPIQSALRDGCETTGVTVFWMSDGMDDGDIALAQEVAIELDEDYGALHDRLAVIGGDLLARAARELAQGILPRIPQRADAATFTRPLSKDDLRLNFHVPARVVVNQVRSLSPKPAGWLSFEGKRLKVLSARSVAADLQVRPAGTQPGELLAWSDEGPVIVAEPGAVALTRVVPEGKPAMSGDEFAKRSRSSR